MSVFFGRLLTSIVLIAFSAYIWIESGEFPANGDQLPRFCAIVAAVILIIMLIKDLLSINKEKIKFDFSYQANKQFVILFFSILYVISIFLILFHSYIANLFRSKKITFEKIWNIYHFMCFWRLVEVLVASGIANSIDLFYMFLIGVIINIFWFLEVQFWSFVIHNYA